MSNQPWALVAFFGGTIVWLWFLSVLLPILYKKFIRSSSSPCGRCEGDYNDDEGSNVGCVDTLKESLLPSSVGGGSSEGFGVDTQFRVGGSDSVTWKEGLYKGGYGRGEHDSESLESLPPGGGRGRNGTVTVHFRPLFHSENKTPLRQVMMMVQITIQALATVFQTEVGTVVGNEGWSASLVKTLTWLLALAADKLRGGGLPLASPFLPAATLLLAVSGTATVPWPPDPGSALPVIEVLDVVFLWCFAVTAAWSALGCVTLAESGGKVKGKEGGDRRVSITERWGGEMEGGGRGGEGRMEREGRQDRGGGG
ncbi:hypothetical protein TrCOL_g3952 [Triparma columacea]|uniref:Uncharacterized protein n=1 Tax=Triparma columacea TaxID=722753 RepID=A0A9W7FYG3_9STRA|nr:hypothetical protein TrCOL_g3952 [Triparma columacea]